MKELWKTPSFSISFTEYSWWLQWRPQQVHTELGASYWRWKESWGDADLQEGYHWDFEGQYNIEDWKSLSVPICWQGVQFLNSITMILGTFCAYYCTYSSLLMLLCMWMSISSYSVDWKFWFHHQFLACTVEVYCISAPDLWLFSHSVARYVCINRKTMQWL